MSSSTNDSPRDFADRFRVESRLGRGGMGDVYRAYDTVLERTVAVKTLTPGNADAQAVERLLREARACARLTHPGIVTVHDVLRAEEGVHIVMEHLQGTSLESLHRFPRFSTLDAKIDIIIGILDALHYAHGRGVVHRDIKPTNVQLLPDGSVKLLDFGIAHLAGASTVTVAGAVTGTAHYASPEQLRGEESDASTDIYSTGILAYEVLTRRRPFDGDSLATVLTRVLHDPLPAMETSFSENFPDIERIIRRATAKRGRDRYGSAEDMKNALTAFLASSREAIVTRQAEVAATSQRLIIEAKSLLSSGRTAEAMPLLTSVLRSDPDAEEARELLRTNGAASREVTGTSTAARAERESTVRPGPDEPTPPSTPDAATAAAPPSAETAMPTRHAEAATTTHASTDSSAAAASAGRPGYGRLAAVPVLVVLAGGILLGLSWMSSLSRDDALSAAAAPSSPESEPVEAGAATSSSAGSSVVGSSASASSASGSSEAAAGGRRESGAAAPGPPAAAPPPAPAAAVRPPSPPAAPAAPDPAPLAAAVRPSSRAGGSGRARPRPRREGSVLRGHVARPGCFGGGGAAGDGRPGRRRQGGHQVQDPPPGAERRRRGSRCRHPVPFRRPHPVRVRAQHRRLSVRAPARLDGPLVRPPAPPGDPRRPEFGDAVRRGPHSPGWGGLVQIRRESGIGDALRLPERKNPSPRFPGVAGRWRARSHSTSRRSSRWPTP